MPPIPVYSDSPIVASKAQGATPSTQDEPTPTSSNPATTTSTTSDPHTSTYQAAKPASAAFPGPTPSAPKPQPAATRTTQSIDNDTPPAPQPGATPQRPTTTAAPTATPTPTKSSYLPPNPFSQPAQMAIPPPTLSGLATRSTTTAPTNTNRPTTLPLDSAAVPSSTSAYASAPEAPGLSGYRQDPYASEMSAQQRASLDVLEASDRRTSIGDWVPGSNAETVDGVWGAVKGWATTAATKAAEMEEEVWKRVNGKN